MSNSMNRRAILAGAATLPAISIPALGTEPDPAFAAVEAYKTASTRLLRATDTRTISDVKL
jgi:hypothetical protein